MDNKSGASVHKNYRFYRREYTVKKSLIDTAMPSVFRWTQEPSPAAASRVKRAVQRNDSRCELFEALPEAHENILVMSEVDFHFNMEAVVELAEGMSIGGVAQTELAFLSYASSLQRAKYHINFMLKWLL